MQYSIDIIQVNGYHQRVKWQQICHLHLNDEVEVVFDTLLSHWFNFIVDSLVFIVLMEDCCIQ